jgi:hypothetical protein
MNPTRAELIRLGMSSTLDGRLRAIREKVGLSRNAQARLMEVTPDALRRWEEAEQGMNSDSALRVGEWVWAAERVLADLADSGVDVGELVPLSTASQYLAMGADEVLRRCQSGDLQCEDLGVLGVYVHRANIPSLETHEEEGER